MPRLKLAGIAVNKVQLFRPSLLQIFSRGFTQAIVQVSKETRDEHDLQERLRLKRKTEWKRRQGGQSFLDHLIVTIRGGRGGDGCAAFHREKFMPYGPPSGGNGGRGADVYILPTPHLTTLSSVPKNIRGRPGGHGQGTWMNGRNAPPTIIRVPLGTVVRELASNDSRRTKNEYEMEEDGMKGLSLSERVQKMREKRWVHYPGAQDDNLDRDAFKEAERMLYRQERDRRVERRQQKTGPLFLDLDSAISSPAVKDLHLSADDDLLSDSTPYTKVRPNVSGHLVAEGGAGGIGNPAFVSATNRSPKFATRGSDGQSITLELELKLLADIGLVGFPNAGKSTLLRALTGGRARTEVAAYAFTTLNPVVGVVRVGEDGGLLEDDGIDGLDTARIVEDTQVEEQRLAEMMERGELANALTRNQGASLSTSAASSDPGYTPLHARMEGFRFTIADNPGLIARASENVGLGHSFLRSIERSLALVYVVDLSGPDPQQELKVLRDELEKYKPGLSAKARMVLANKADLLGGEDEAAVQEAKEKLRKLEVFVKEEMRSVHAVERRAVEPRDPEKMNDSENAGSEKLIEVGKVLDVVPISGKYSQNLKPAIRLLRAYIEEARGALDDSRT